MNRRQSSPDYVGPVERSNRLEIVNGVLRRYRRRLFRPDRLERETNLDQVRHLHWYTSPFSRVGTVRVTLWDRPTAFEVLFDTSPRDKEARELGWFRAPDLRADPTAHLAFVAFFAPRLEEGIISSAVDLRTLRPLEPSGEPAPGVFRTENQFIYDPHLAKTERQMRAERDQ